MSANADRKRTQSHFLPYGMHIRYVLSILQTAYHKGNSPEKNHRYTQKQERRTGKPERLSSNTAYAKLTLIIKNYSSKTSVATHQNEYCTPTTVTCALAPSRTFPSSLIPATIYPSTNLSP